MKLNETKKVDTNLYELNITVDGEQYAKALDASFKKNAAKLNIPGFRKGKAPKSIVYKMVGESYFYEDAINSSYGDAYEEALKESGLEAVAYPEVELKDADGTQYTFVAKVTVKPEVTLGEYKGLKVERESDKVTDADIENELNAMADRNARMAEAPEGAKAELGDTAVIDYEGFVGDVAFEGGKGEDHALVLGSGQFIPGFESQLVGAHAGSDVLVTVTFPKDYRATELAGKPAEFRCHIVEVREKSAYELDDVFAKEVGGCQTLEEMKQKLRQSLQDYYDERAEMEVQDTLMRQAAATLDYTPSAQELKEGIDAQVELLKAQLGRKGLTLEAYLQFTGKTEQQIRDDAKPEAENSLRIQKSAERIALLEGLTATDEDYANELAAICRQNGLTMEQLKPHMNAQFEASVRDNIRMKKAIAFVRANADVTVVDAPASKD